jgi:hypothetical protein
MMYYASHKSPDPCRVPIARHKMDVASEHQGCDLLWRGVPAALPAHDELNNEITLVKRN